MTEDQAYEAGREAFGKGDDVQVDSYRRACQHGYSSAWCSGYLDAMNEAKAAE